MGGLEAKISYYFCELEIALIFAKRGYWGVKKRK